MASAIRRALALALLVSVLDATPALAAQVGFKSHSYAGFAAEATGGDLTGQKPESKLWYHDGSWWAAMLSRGANGSHTIFRLQGDEWTDTGVVVDPRAATKEDVLSLGSTLYILSRSGDGTSNRLRRFTYAAGTYRLDSGFPVDVPGANAETTVLARDSQGKLWLTYESGSKIFVAHSRTSDTDWGAPFVIPVAPASGLTADDISSIISFTDNAGPAVGVFWSNQNTQNDYFAVHRDGAADSQWSLETALSSSLSADDHINLKTAEGRVFAVVKTSSTTTTDARIRLLVRSTSGAWARFTVAVVSDRNTRPLTMLQIDRATRSLFVFMTIGEGANANGIEYKKASLDSISFSGAATTFIQGANGEPINNPTSMKQNATDASGIVLLASDGTNYWWNRLGGAPPANAAPVAQNAAVTTEAGKPVAVTLSATDVETCNLTFSIVSPPAHGTLGGLSNAACTPGPPNSDRATVTYTPNTGFSGTDSFTFKANDGAVDSNTGVVSVTVNAPANTRPTAQNTSVTSDGFTPVEATLAATDAETCDLSFAIVAPPSKGTVGTVNAAACSPGSPNSDRATVTYTPPPGGFSGTDSFTFKANDGTDDSNIATVTVNGPPPPNTPPTADNAIAATTRNTPVQIMLVARDAETCELLFATNASPPTAAGGTVSIDQAPACTPGSPNTDTATATYSPPADFVGTDTFAFVADDGTASSQPATVTVTVGAPSVQPISLRASSSAANPTATTLTIGKPAGVVAGDVMVAQIDVRGAPGISAPSGWTLIRSDANGTSMKQAAYYKVAGTSEPASYTWTFSASRAAAGGIAAFSGVDNVTPIDASSGRVEAASTTSIRAPSVTTTVPNAMLVGLFGVARNNSVTPPSGMAEQWDVATTAADTKITSEAATALQSSAGATGERVATAATDAPNVGQLVALRPAAR